SAPDFAHRSRSPDNHSINRKRLQPGAPTMLYQIREAQRAVLKPICSWADSMSHLYGDPYSPLAMVPFASRISAGFELLYRLGKDYEKPEFGLSATRIDGTEVPVFERVEMNFPFCRLLKFERLLPKSLAHRSTDPTVLVFAPLSGHHATLLRDTVRDRKSTR